MTPLIESLTIQGYRRFEKLELNGFGRVNVIVGDNNAGKTSVLEAIALLADPLNIRTWLSVVEGRTIKGFSTLSRTDGLRWLFRKTGPLHNDAGSRLSLDGKSARGAVTRHINAAMARREIPESSPFGPPTVREQDGANGLIEVIDLHVEAGDGDSVWTTEARVVPSPKPGLFPVPIPFANVTVSTANPEPPFPAIPWVLFSPHEHLVDDMLVRGVSEATRTLRKQSVLDLLKTFAPIDDIALLSSERQSVFLLDQRAGWVPVSSLGEGLRRCLALALSVTAARGGVLLIDEIETAVHRSMLEKVFGWLTKACKENDVQLFCTTHSLEAVDALVSTVPPSEDKESDIVLFRLPNGTTDRNPRRFDHRQIDLLREDGIEVR